ncbi:MULTISPECIES: phage holin family protein [unclassified Acinetobacter]|uniref:phage holin family protein n=1 Tax=unclassified Acinetobacter TaxID=196816 RepID=UPI0015D23BC1|nr:MULTISPECIES: phage holin family protein [unclassified Acinetobacter]
MDDLKQMWSALEPFYTAVASFVMAFLMAIFRTAKKHGKADWLEALMCGLFAIGAWSLMTWLGIPEIVAVGVSSAIGYKGTHFVSDKIDKVEINVKKDHDSTN